MVPYFYRCIRQKEYGIKILIQLQNPLPSTQSNKKSLVCEVLVMYYFFHKLLLHPRHRSWPARLYKIIYTWSSWDLEKKVKEDTDKRTVLCRSYYHVKETGNNYSDTVILGSISEEEPLLRWW